IDLAIIGESARWGDAMASTPRTRNKDWLPEFNNLTSKFFPKRGSIVINQLKEAGLFPVLMNPVVSSNNSEIVGEIMYFDTEVNITLHHSNSSGKLYYTTDGTDPRNDDGSLNYKATQVSAEVALNLSLSTQIKARVKNNDDWSGLRQISFLKNTEDYTGLKITEIHYHPWDLVIGTDTTENKDLEFIELKNESTKAINISGIIIDSAAYYQVPEATLLNPGAFYVVASKPKAFYLRYGMNPSGNFSGNLDNSGEFLLITDRGGNKILSCTYDDQYPWPEAADGMGFSLAASVTRSTQNPDEPAYWKKSVVRHGSPFDNDTPIVTNEDLVLETFPNPTHESLNIRLDNLMSSQTMDVSVINQLGKTVYNNQREDTNIETINFTSLGLPPGTYIVKIKTKTQQWIQKIIYL
ncbi:MAG: lamin tail domain-containing protein, partial [Salinivirgaceae bacterium]|nr:lamin tail domain-containing protein [Salinivirgaceae bacterium]